MSGRPVDDTWQPTTDSVSPTTNPAAPTPKPGVRRTPRPPTPGGPLGHGCPNSQRRSPCRRSTPDVPALARAAQQTVQESTAMFNALPPERQQAVTGAARSRSACPGPRPVFRLARRHAGHDADALGAAVRGDVRPALRQAAAVREGGRPAEHSVLRGRPGSLPTPTNSGTRPNGSANSKRPHCSISSGWRPTWRFRGCITTPGPTSNGRTSSTAKTPARSSTRAITSGS